MTSQRDLQRNAEYGEYYRDKKRLDWLITQPARIAHSNDGDCCWLHWSYDPVDEERRPYNQLMTYATPREAIDAAMSGADNGQSSPE